MKTLLLSVGLVMIGMAGMAGIPTLGGPTLSGLGGGGSTVTGYSYLTLSPTSTIPAVKVPIYGSASSVQSINALYQALQPYFPNATWVEQNYGSNSLPANIPATGATNGSAVYPCASITYAAAIAPTNGSAGQIVVLDGTYWDNVIYSNNESIYLCPSVTISNDATAGLQSFVYLSGVQNVTESIYGQGNFNSPSNGIIIQTTGCSNVVATVQGNNVLVLFPLSTIGASTNITATFYGQTISNGIAGSALIGTENNLHFGSKVSFYSPNPITAYSVGSSQAGNSTHPPTNAWITVSSPTNTFVYGNPTVDMLGDTLVLGQGVTYISNNVTTTGGTTNFNIQCQIPQELPYGWQNATTLPFVYGNFFSP